jgi:hypothetical protein
MLAFAADLHFLAGCDSCLFSTRPYVTSYGVVSSHVFISWSLYDLCLLDRMLPCLATG